MKLNNEELVSKTIFIEKLNTPNKNKHIYTTECIEKALLKNKEVQEKISSKFCCFIFSKPVEHISISFDNVIGIVNSFYIENNVLYAEVQVPDYVEGAYLAGSCGSISEDGYIEDYEFEYLFIDQDCIGE